MTRLNKFLAERTGISRREADNAIEQGKVLVNGKKPALGAQIAPEDDIQYDGRKISHSVDHTTILLNKPVGYLCSRRSQGGNKTIYDILPEKFHGLKPAGRLDRDSSGLVLLTSDGDLAYQTTHPKFAKTKIYEIELDKPLEPLHQQMINDTGIELTDGNSKLTLEKFTPTRWRVIMHEGRNRQIRRTFMALGYTVTKLHRTNFGPYALDGLKVGLWREIQP